MQASETPKVWHGVAVTEGVFPLEGVELAARCVGDRQAERRGSGTAQPRLRELQEHWNLENFLNTN